ncbi:MAG TPA: ATP-binding protein [Methylocystis sp.]|nr:ATP-binding protein [Methylocystis sp.]
MTPPGKLFRTTAFKLSLVYLVLFSLGATLVFGVVAWRVQKVFDEEFNQAVEADADPLLMAFEVGGRWGLEQAINTRVRESAGALLLLTNFTGDYLAGNFAGSFKLPMQSGASVEVTYKHIGSSDRERMGLIRLLVLDGGFRLYVGYDIEDQVILRRILSKGLGAWLSWLVLIGALGGILVAYRMLERVEAMSASARRIMAGDLEQRLEVTGAGDELDRLAENLNAMLARIGALMTGLREVSDNIAHDLKTPLTRLRNRAEEALRNGASEAEPRAALASVIEEADALIGVFDALLLIARAEAGYSSDLIAPFDASEVAKDIAELYEPLVEERGVTLSTSIEPGLYAEGHRELLGRALANLVDNALKYGIEGEAPQIALAARRVGPMIELSVADHGPGVPAKDLERVTGRFVRLDNARNRPGSGLGLSLAAAVARLHQGELRLEDNHPGLRAVIALAAGRAPAEAETTVRPA